MKKSYLMMASALVLSMAATGVAEARDGFYAAVRGGYTDYNVNSKKDAAVDDSKLELGGVASVSGAIGYKYRYFRIEGEYIFRGDIDDKYKQGDSAFGPYGDKVTLETDSFMANAYFDLMPNYWISPYVSGGIGISRVDLKNSVFGSSVPVEAVEYSENNFTWQVGGGLSLRLNRCLNFDAGYRYIDMGDIEDANINVHEWYGGLRYTF